MYGRAEGTFYVCQIAYNLIIFSKSLFKLTFLNRVHPLNWSAFHPIPMQLILEQSKHKSIIQSFKLQMLRPLTISMYILKITFPFHNCSIIFFFVDSLICIYVVVHILVSYFTCFCSVLIILCFAYRCIDLPYNTYIYYLMSISFV